MNSLRQPAKWERFFWPVLTCAVFVSLWHYSVLWTATKVFPSPLEVAQGIAEASQVRAQIRVPFNRYARMVFAVSDENGNILGLYRMPDATYFSIGVAVARSRLAMTCEPKLSVTVPVLATPLSTWPPNPTVAEIGSPTSSVVGVKVSVLAI